MKKVWAVLLTMMMGLAVAGCSGAADMESNKNNAAPATEGAADVRITPEKAKEIMDENKNAVILDVRTESEYAEKHIPGARLVPNEQISNTPIKGLHKNDVILVYCRSGNRSKQATEKLLKMGYEHVYDFGGINRWPYETEAGTYKTT